MAFILELHGYSGKLNKHLHSMISFIENGEEKLRRLRKLGVSKVANRWLSDHARSKTITAEEYLSLKKTKKTETMLDVIKAADETQKSLGKNYFLSSISKTTALCLKSIFSV